MISFAGYEDYGRDPLPEGMNPVAFNFLHYRLSRWTYLFQPQEFNALSLAPARRLHGEATVRSVL